MVSTIIFVSYVESSNCMGVFLILCIEVDEKNSLIFFVITVKLECSSLVPTYLCGVNHVVHL